MYTQLDNNGGPLCLEGHAKEPYLMSMSWEPGLLFLKLLAHLCAVTFMTEISSTVMNTTNKQTNLLLTFVGHCDLSCDLENDFVLNKVFQVLMSPGT